MEDTSLDRDTDLIQEYVELLDRKAGRPSPFGKVAAGHKLGALRALLRRAAARHPDPELERAEAAAAAEATSSGWRRFATSYWGSRLLMALVLVGGQQLVLLVLYLLGLGYSDLTMRPVDPEKGVQWAPAQLDVLFLILFVFAFFFVTPLFSVLLLWGGRYVRAWRKAVPATLLLLLAASAFTWLSFRGTQNPAYAKDSLHQFLEARQLQYKTYDEWLKINWLLKDPRFQADYERYLRNGPGRWLSNRFDTADSAEWASPQSLKFIGEFADTEHDQDKFREWVADYVERNRIYSSDIESDVSALVGPSQQRFLSVWQATPFLRDRDVHVRRHYYGQVFAGVRRWGLVYFGSLILLYVLVYLAGPALRGGGWAAGTFRFERAATAVGRARDRYYSFPERREISGEPFFDSAWALLGRVHRSFVRAVLAVSVACFAVWALWLAGQGGRPDGVGTQRALMDRFVIVPTPRDRAGEPVRPSELASGRNPGGAAWADSPAPNAAAGPRGPFAGFGLDQNGDGYPDPEPLPPVESRLLALQRQFDDAEWETGKRFKATEAVLATYKQQLDQLRAENAALSRRAEEIAASIPAAVGAVQGQISAAASAAESAAARAEAVAGEAAEATGRAEALEKRADALDRRAGQLESADTEMRTQLEGVETDLDERTRELRARTERLGDRATDLADRTEQLAQLQRTAYRYLVEEVRTDLASLERRSHSRIYRIFNRKEALARLEDMRRRIQVVRALLQSSAAPEADALFKELTDLQRSIGSVEERFD